MNDNFLQSIIDAPDDDAPRLVFADFLEENGEPERAEFIRVQCELAKPSGLCFACRRTVEDFQNPQLRRAFQKQKCHCTAQTKALRRREREIAESHGKKWISEMLGVK